MVFSPFLLEFGSKSAELNKKIPQGLLELGSSKVCAMGESPQADGQSLSWGAQAVPQLCLHHSWPMEIHI